MSTDLIDQTLGNLACSLPGATRVFRHYRLDFCCGGDLSLGEAARRIGVEPQVIAEALLALEPEEAQRDWRNVPAGELIDYLPASQGAQARVEPVYETLEGWKGTTAGARSWNDLPAQAVKYVRYIEELIGAPVAMLSTSPEREDTILVQNPFEA